MSHEISEESGRAEIAYAGETPWHGLGNNVGECKTTQEMIVAAGMNYLVVTRPLYIQKGEPAAYTGIESHVAIVREDTERVLGVASDRYAPIQNTQCADLVDALITEGGAHVEVAGALGYGERCWMLAHIPGDFEVVKGDQVKPYFLLVWGHDGKHGLAGKLTGVRVVCKNTLEAAGFGVRGVKWSAAADIYIRHSKNAKVNLEAAREALGVAKKQVETTSEAYKALAGVSLSEPVVKGYFESVFPMPDGDAGADGSDERKTYEQRLARWNAHQGRLLALYETGRGTEIPGVRGTAWAAYNAVTEWADHVYPVLQNGVVSKTRQASVAFGAYSETKSRALEGALALIG